MTLTHTPAHTINRPDRFVDDETGKGYEIRPDQDAIDPRTHLDNRLVALWGHRQLSTRSAIGGDKPEGNVAIDTFAHLLLSHDEDVALTITRRYLAVFHPHRRVQLEIRTIRGYCQGDEAGVIAAVEQGHGSPEDHIEEFRQWIFGDVWVVTPDDKPSVCNIYAASAEEALAHYRESFENTYFTRDLRLFIRANDGRQADGIVEQVLNAIDYSDALPAGITATVLNNDPITCPRHGGPWGDDVTCPMCIAANGNVRKQPTTVTKE